MADFGSRFVGLSVRIEAERREMAALGEARRLVRLVRSNGGQITTDGVRVNVKGFRPDHEVVEQLRAAKSAIIACLVTEEGEPR